MAGLVFVLVAALSLGSTDPLGADPSVLLASGALALVLGSLLYGVYRALLQPLTLRGDLRRAIAAVGTPEERKLCLDQMKARPRGGEPELVWRLMDARASGRRSQRAPWAGLEGWAAMIQLLYCTAFAVALALSVAFAVASSRGAALDPLATAGSGVAGLVLLTAARASGSRYLQAELRALLAERRPAEPDAPPPGGS